MGKDLQKKLIILFVMTLNGILFQAMVLWDFSSEALLPTMMYAYISPLFFLMMVFLLTALINIFRLTETRRTKTWRLLNYLLEYW